MPASVFSRSTECHNQDKVSMGTIAARDCMRVIGLTEQTLAAGLLAAAQALKLRLNKGELPEKAAAGVQETCGQVFSFFEFLEDDRPLEKELRKAVELIGKEHFRV
jgi:histidine ammonia-lyase